MADPTTRNPHRRGWARRCSLAGAVAVIAAGGALVAIAIDQHVQHRSAVAGQDAQRRNIERRAAAEARPTTPTPGASTAGSHRPASAGTHGPVSAGTHGPVSAGTHGPVSTITAAGATLVVPALEVRAPIVATGALNGSMIIPSNIQTVGWYDGIDSDTSAAAADDVIAAHTAPWPGQPGVAILAGHVDWAGQGPGALYYLAQLQVGDPIQVIGSNAQTTRWQVSQRPLILSKAALPASLFVNTGPPELALVTCGGPFDRTTGHYLDNVIVWATPTTA